MGKQTPLYPQHQAAGAKLVDFAGYDMPLHYGSQLEEHHRVRREAGVFDVSHMRVVDVAGPDAQAFLRRLLANDVARLRVPGKALYTCMLNDDAGVVDDLIVYFLGPERYRLVVNAGTADKDLAWMRANAQGSVDIRSREDLAILAVQGPAARGRVLGLLDPGRRAAAEALEAFFGVDSDGWFIGRTGYTGEDGFELIVPAADVRALWQQLLAAGVVPVGLGARDTLRLEAGMNLYGQDMDEGVSPLESGLGWTVAWEPAERHFIGRPALEAERTAGARRKLVGLVLEERGVLRAHMPVHTGQGVGETTSGSFAPTLGGSIALARVPAAASGDCEVEIRGKRLKARMVKLPFVRHGKVLI